MWNVNCFSNVLLYCRTPSAGATPQVNGPTSSVSGASVSSLELQQIKQEILSEIRSEMNKFKQEILDGMITPNLITSFLLFIVFVGY